MRVRVAKDIEKSFLEPSFRFLVKNGLENTSVRDLCRVMGVSSGNIYYWFKDKEDIYISVIMYGLERTASALFRKLFDKIDNLQEFFETFIDEIDCFSTELRLCFQAVCSPIYGGRLREQGNNFKGVYEKYISHMAKALNCSTDLIRPVIYKIISILVDYVLWEDRETSLMLLKDVYETMLMKLEIEKNRID